MIRQYNTMSAILQQCRKIKQNQKTKKAKKLKSIKC